MIARGRREHAVELGAALRALQQRSGRTLRALEEQVRISDSSLSRYFRGDTVPPWPVVRDLCRALGADPFAYRTLWEAAERGPDGPPPPADAQVPPPSPSPAPLPAPLPPPAEEPPPTEELAPGAAPGAAPAGRRPRTLLTGRATAAATGALGGLTAGFLLALLVLPTAPTGSPGHGTAAEGDAPTTRATSAGAPERSGAVRTFVSRSTGYCLDSSLDHGLRSYPCNGMSYQRWGVLSGADGTHRLRNHATGLCLEDSGTAVRARPCDGSTAQTWTLTEREDEAVRLQNASTGHCLDESSAGLRALTCADGRRQEWG